MNKYSAEDIIDGFDYNKFKEKRFVLFSDVVARDAKIREWCIEIRKRIEKRKCEPRSNADYFNTGQLELLNELEVLLSK